MNVLLVGDVCIDRNVSENAKYLAAGGASMFMNRICSKFDGVTSTIISNYGTDFLLYLTHVSIYSNNRHASKTLMYENHTKNGPRTQKVYNADVSQPVTFDVEVKKLAKNADAVVFAPLLPNYSAQYIETFLNASKKDALRVLLPQGYFREVGQNGIILNRLFNEDKSIIPLFDIIILSEEDHPDITDITTHWLSYADVKIIVTMGEKGARLASRNESFVVPTTPISTNNIVDSVGAGDIFSASFIYEYMQSYDIRKSIEFGNSIAGQSLAYTPDQLEVAHFTID